MMRRSVGRMLATPFYIIAINPEPAPWPAVAVAVAVAVLFDTCLWNLVINLPVGPPLQREEVLRSVALFHDGNMPATAYTSEDAYTWDVHVIPNEADLEDLFPVGTNLAPKDIFQHERSQEYSTRRALRSVTTFQTDADASPKGGIHPHSSANALLARLFAPPPLSIRQW
ncbi:hypothetical protein BDR06DRAFT_1007179 [Suillus hirtellus]|nr:hypothetical protein BDR06DRAFT_1007179 [Suillus hirtellus]